MPGIDDPKETTGRVTQFGVSGFGPNSGEFTLGITTDDGKFVQVFGGVMSYKREATGLEPGVFAAFCNLASTAFISKAHVRCVYRLFDKQRVTGIELLP